mgnify:CR=1 FL=1
MIPERLSRLRREMEQRRIDVYVVPTADFHESEYVGAHFKARSYITGFTGSAGTAIITMTEAGLWTDARYFLQAKHQLENTGVTLYRMGEEGVPTIMEYLRSALPEGGTLGFDGRVINARLGAEFLALAEEKNARLAVGEDLVGIIWDDRPELPHAPVRILTAEYSGRSTADKLADVRAEMKKQGASVHLLTSLYDIAWLLNVRGGDIDYVPVVLSYLALTEEQCLWFVQDAVLTDELRAYLAENRIETRPYESFYDYAAAIPAGETVALVGPSGGGKSTLCQLLPRFYDVDEGSIRIDGLDVRQVTQSSLRRAIGIVQQDVFLFADTIRENIRYGRPGASDEEVEAAAKRAEIYDDIMAMPDGFDTYVGERGTLLSGGQKQRVSIARIFLKDPPILILDEATSALDSVTEAKIQGAFDELSRGRTTLIIAHRLSTIRAADRILVIQNGRIAEEGSHRQLLALNGAYAKLYRTQDLGGSYGQT